MAVVLWFVDPRAAWDELRSARIAPLLGALALSQMVIVASALRWADTCTRLGRSIPIREAVSEYYLSSLFNQVLPGGIAGDAVRAWRGRSRGGALPVARGVAIERMSGQVAMAAALLAGVALGGVPGTGRLVGAFVAGVIAVLAALVIVLKFGADLRRAWGTGPAILAQALLNLAIVAGLVGGFALCARAVGTGMGLADALVVIPVCLAAMLVPVGIGGLGMREGAAAALWPLAGFAAEAGVAASLLFGGVSLLGAMPGLVVLVHRRR
ncbi:uncharacterized membrane protein YbhN (UPF0104 family) [Palleronia aestuarii]|uniref:Uncharacterized membrane protein YbhN (UPF0104 family) n=1 Tax=Palleronia aestuarii TaxID=568105 RepID=A0A2W7N8F2_9RHOB|nr:uncharacterized membrane protein YbhN (UPF0104 family) [Palleronia aestuarii]